MSGHESEIRKTFCGATCPVHHGLKMKKEEEEEEEEKKEEEEEEEEGFKESGHREEGENLRIKEEER
jgi:hypothetical protein